VQSRFIINAVLLVIVSGLAVFLVYSGKQQPVVENIPLTNLDSAGVNSIQIERKSSDTIRFVKDGQKWLMQSPYQLPANEYRINTMLNLLEAHSYTQFTGDDVELNRFLLAAPDLAIRFNDTPIYFGDTSPLDKQRYVLVDDTVHLINDSLYEQLQAPATFFLSTRLLPEDSEILVINFPGYTVSQKTGVWTISPQTEMSTDRIVALVNAWQTLDAISIRAYEATANTDSIRIDAGTSGKFDFIISAPAPNLVLARPDIGIQYHISGYDSEQLFLPKTADTTGGAEPAGKTSPITNN
jgi:hypothetical protein